MNAAPVHTVLDSPVGPLILAGRHGVLTGLYFHRSPRPTGPGLLGRRDERPFGPVAEQLDAYFAGSLTEFDLPIAPTGTAFQQSVWEALRQIPFGCTESYTDVARRIGRPAAVRAVGAANGRNPIAIVVPCHRVIGADGGLTGFGGGLDAKRTLLDLEAGRAGRALPLS